MGQCWAGGMGCPVCLCAGEMCPLWPLKYSKTGPDMFEHAYNPSTWVAEAGGLPQVQGQLRLHGESPPMFLKQTTTKKLRLAFSIGQNVL